MMAGAEPIDSTRRHELEQERDFLLTSIADLDTEYQVGDLEHGDYRVLRDGYTARAAVVLRELQQGEQYPAPVRRLRWKTVAIAAALLVGLFGVTWWALTASSAQRLPNQSMTGLDPRSERQRMLSEAYRIQFERPDQAAVLYGLVLKEFPRDVEALTYGGWTRALAVVRANADSETLRTELTASAEMLTTAIGLDDQYPDPRCLRGVLYGRFLQRAEPAIADLDRCLELNPPADMRQLVSGLRSELAGSPSSSSPRATATTER